MRWIGNAYVNDRFGGMRMGDYKNGRGTQCISDIIRLGGIRMKEC